MWPGGTGHALCLLLLVVTLVVLLGTQAFAQVRVRGYTRKDGTYVAPYYRTSPDSSRSNNWSTQGNVNPYTGKLGTKPVDAMSPSYPYPSAAPSQPSVATVGTAPPVDYQAIANRPSELTLLRTTAFKHACYTGCSSAVGALPKAANQTELIARAFLSCDDSVRSKADLLESENLLTLACSVGVATTFTAFSLRSELVDSEGRAQYSPRALDALSNCLGLLAKDKVPGAKGEQERIARFRTATPQGGATNADPR